MIRKIKAVLGRAAFVSIAVLLALLAALNIFVTLLPAGVTHIDTSGTQMYTPSELSERFIDKLDEEITMYFLCEGGVTHPSVETLLQKYEAISDHISYEVVDVAKHPEFTEKYLGIAYDKLDDDGYCPINNFSVIIESAKRFYVIDFTNFYHYRAQVDGRNYSLALGELAEFIQYYPTSKYITYFDADKCFLTGLDYVTLDFVDTVYVLRGHGEREIYNQFYQNLKYTRVNYDDLYLSEVESIPDTCSGLVIVAPKEDLSDEDTQKLLDFIDRGGEILLVTAPENAGFENLLKVTAAFGMTAKEGVIHDSGLASYVNDYYKLLPTPNGTHGMVSYINTTYSTANITTLPILPNSHAILPTVQLENGDNELGATVTRILYTSSFSERIDGDKVLSLNPQSYAVGMSSNKVTTKGDKNATMYWYSSYEAFTARYISSEYITEQQIKPGEVNQSEPRPINLLYLLHSLAYMGSADDFESTAVKNIVSPRVEIPLNASLGLGMGNPLAVPQKAPIVIGVAAAIVIPIAVLAVSIAIWARRRHRR